MTLIANYLRVLSQMIYSYFYSGVCWLHKADTIFLTFCMRSGFSLPDSFSLSPPPPFHCGYCQTGYMQILLVFFVYIANKSNNLCCVYRGRMASGGDIIQVAVRHRPSLTKMAAMSALGPW